ncbi:hypothetical protein ACQ4LE_008359, partial [Meloidogyne hapla]
MTDEGLSNSDMELKEILNKHTNNLIKLQTNFNNFKLKFIEEKDKNEDEKKILKEKNIFLENELKNLKKEMNEKIQKILSDNNQKDEKINLLEEQIKKEILNNQTNNFQLQTNFNNFLLKFIEEKEKTFNHEKKNNSFENELKEINEKIQKINFDHDKEIGKLKQNFQQLIDEKIKEIEIKFVEDKEKNENEKKIIENKNNSFENEIKNLKQLIDNQTDEKINFLEEQFNQKIQKINFDHDEEIGELKQNFKELIDEKIKEDKNEISSLIS